MGRFDDVLHSNHIRCSEAGYPPWLQASELALPAAIDSERALLEALLIDGEQMLSVVEILPPGRGSWFYRDAHRLIYDAMLTLMERNDSIDLQAVTDGLHRRNQLEKIGGSVYLASLMEEVTTTANTAYQARLVREKALYRALINIAMDMSACEQTNLQEVIERAHQAVLQVSGAQINDAFAEYSQLMRLAIHAAQHADERDLTGIDTGFPELNSLTGGFQNSTLILVAARPSMGKSSLAVQFAQSAAVMPNSAAVVFFSLEMSSDRLAQRSPCSEARVDSTLMKRGFLNRSDWGWVLNAGNRLERLPMVISLGASDRRQAAQRPDR